MPTKSIYTQGARFWVALKRFLRAAIPIAITLIAAGHFQEPWILGLAPVLIALEKYLRDLDKLPRWL